MEEVPWKVEVTAEINHMADTKLAISILSLFTSLAHIRWISSEDIIVTSIGFSTEEISISVIYKQDIPWCPLPNRARNLGRLISCVFLNHRKCWMNHYYFLIRIGLKKSFPFLNQEYTDVFKPQTWNRARLFTSICSTENLCFQNNQGLYIYIYLSEEQV